MRYLFSVASAFLLLSSFPIISSDADLPGTSRSTSRITKEGSRKLSEKLRTFARVGIYGSLTFLVLYLARDSILELFASKSSSTPQNTPSDTQELPDIPGVSKQRILYAPIPLIERSHPQFYRRLKLRLFGETEGLIDEPIDLLKKIGKLGHGVLLEASDIAMEVKRVLSSQGFEFPEPDQKLDLSKISEALKKSEDPETISALSLLLFCAKQINRENCEEDGRPKSEGYFATEIVGALELWKSARNSVPWRDQKELARYARAFAVIKASGRDVNEILALKYTLPDGGTKKVTPEFLASFVEVVALVHRFLEIEDYGLFPKGDTSLLLDQTLSSNLLKPQVIQLMAEIDSFVEALDEEKVAAAVEKAFEGKFRNVFSNLELPYKSQVFISIARHAAKMSPKKGEEMLRKVFDALVESSNLREE